ncbi:MAG: amidohydrolase [Pirellulaceae bacterium]|nr:amidohydrolase [Pirellulaceae bacterium]
MTAIRDLSAIDVHGHYGRYERVGTSILKQQFMSGDPATVVARARQANTAYTVVSPMLAMMPRGEADAVAGNEEAQRVVHETDGLLQWVVVNPLQPETFDQARRMLGLPQCVGIKIHPEEHCYPIVDHGRAILEFAAEQGAVVLSHSGELNSLPKDFTRFADDFPEVKLILAHLGHSGATGTSCDLQVRAILASKHGNVLTDTSSSLSITPGLIEWAVREVGADRILYGSDTPVYFAPSQRARIDRADLTDTEKRMILCDNARRLLPFFRQSQAQREDDSC